MSDTIYKMLGRASLIFDFALRLISMNKKAQEHKHGQSEFDKTGLIVKEARPLNVLWNDSEILYVAYDSFALSFWRAQEFSLFLKHKHFIQEPILDFGCGDGSFASVLLKEIDFGVDNNSEALKVAESYGIYKRLLQSSNSSIPIKDTSIQSVISNSVLEHLKYLDDILSEINRILVQGGIFIFTVPTIQFKEDLAKYFGRKESERINVQYYHHNLLNLNDWKNLLNKHGFHIVLLKQYQPAWFTFRFRMYRLFSDRGLGFILPKIKLKVWEKNKLQIVDMIRRSINTTEEGANIFVISKKV